MEQSYVILMVEDEDNVREVNKRMLKRRGYEFKEAKSAGEAYEVLDHIIPDLLILDIMLPDGNGFEICNHFRNMSDNPVIILSGKTETEDKVEGLSCGCDYYLTKPYSFDELLAVVNRLLQRKDREHFSVGENKKVMIGDMVLDLSDSRVLISGEDVHLTKTEFIMLKIFVENKEKVLSAEEIYRLVWKSIPNGDVRNVRKHVMNIRNKIRAEDSTKYDIITTYGKGYIFVEY